MELPLAFTLLFLLSLVAVTGLALCANPLYGTDDVSTLIDRIDALLPQTQCGKCHYDGCRPYAEAIARGHADINRCPPGGSGTISRIAELLGRENKPLDIRHGSQHPPQVAVIDEDLCIGCVKCIRACPVDAIIGAAKMMHTVIPEQCTGCELCLAPCPVDCISMVPVENCGGTTDRTRQQPPVQTAARS